MSLEEAVDAPRLHLEKCGTLSFEPGLPEAVQGAFRAAGEKARAWPERNLFFGGVHAARRFGDGGVEGAGDPRRGGVVIVV
jgi:gamma-glutamyltranspeptidase/glutathione hydrolase